MQNKSIGDPFDDNVWNLDFTVVADEFVDVYGVDNVDKSPVILYKN